jgi:hypothetical protein
MITTLTYNLAKQICSGEKWSLEDFYKNGNCNDVFMFPHYNFFYSYPEFGKKWANGKYCEFHRIEIACHMCKTKPNRIYAGIGNIYLLHNGISDETICVSKGHEIVRGRKIMSYEYVPNTPKLSRFICLCENDIGSYFHYGNNKNNKIPISQPINNNQLQLF